MTERDLVFGEVEIVLNRIVRAFNGLDVLPQLLPNLRLRKHLQAFDQFMAIHSEDTPCDFGEVIVNGRTDLLGESSRLFRFELSLNLEIQRDLNDHTKDYLSGFVLTWTHQREEITPLTGGEASRDEV